MPYQICYKTLKDILSGNKNIQYKQVYIRNAKPDTKFDTSRYLQHKLSGERRKSGFAMATKFIAISFGSIICILIILFNIIGCSDMPYTGPLLQPGDVDQYFQDHGNGLVCLHNGMESACVTLVPKPKESSLPVIHIHPSRTIYVFYYKGEVILEAERVSDNSDLIDELIDGETETITLPETNTVPLQLPKPKGIGIV